MGEAARRQRADRRAGPPVQVGHPDDLDVLDGRVAVQCHITLTKRTVREMGRFVDARPQLAFLLFVGSALTLVSALVLGAVWLVRAALR